MKPSFLLIGVLSVLLAAWFWPKENARHSVLIVAAINGELASRDRSLIASLPAGLRNSADAEGVELTVHMIDSQQPAAVLAEKVAEYIKAGTFVVMGCGDSACVRTLLPVVDKHDAVLLYPGSSEGLMHSENLVHLGPVANQYLFPSISWLRQNLGQDMMFIGSESARSHMLSQLISDQLMADEDSVFISEEYIRDPQEIDSVLSKVADYQPEIALLDSCEWLNNSNLVAGINETGTRVFSLCVDEPAPAGTSIYYVSSYFDHEHNPENERLKASLGPLSPIQINSDWMVRLWQQGVQEGALLTAREWLASLRNTNALTAAGPAQIDQHLEGTWRQIYIIRQEPVDGQSRQRLLWMSDAHLRPVMFPGQEAPSDWRHYLTIYWRNAAGEWRTARLDGGQG